MKVALIVLGAFVGILTANVISFKKLFNSAIGGQQKVNDAIFTMIERINKDVFNEVLDKE